MTRAIPQSEVRSNGPAADTGTRWNRVLRSDRQLKDHQQGIAPGPRIGGP
jgi:hypothetical protein